MTSNQLRIDFGTGVSAFGFGAALNATAAPSRMQIELFIEQQSVGTYEITLDRTTLSQLGGTNSNSEGSFQIQGLVGVTAARITNFGDGTANGSAFHWVIDNVMVGVGAMPDVKVNGSDGPLVLTVNETATFTLALEPGSDTGTNAEWWIALATPVGMYWLTPAGWMSSPAPMSLGQGPLTQVPVSTLGAGALLPGLWVLLFALDDTPDGLFEPTWYDYVVVLSAAASIQQ